MLPCRGKKERNAAVPVKKALCCRASEKGRYAALLVKKVCYAAVRVKKSAMLHKWYKRVLCCRAGEKERHAA